MFSKQIFGDPLTADRHGHIKLDWCDRVINDQLAIYADWSEVNEEKNACAGWEEHLERITQRAEDVDIDLEVRWWTYRGKNLKDGARAPLVICLYEYYTTCWQRIADREGLVIVAFEYHRNSRLPEGGLGTLGFGPRPDEIVSYHLVAERVIRECCCDPLRVYIVGLSYGDMSSMVYAKRYAKELCGLASVNGPSAPYNLYRYGLLDDDIPALPVIQFRSDDDFSCDGYPLDLKEDLGEAKEWIRNIRSHLVTENRNVWLKANGADVRDVKIHTDKKRAYLCYTGGKYDVIFAELYGKGHILPIDHAEAIWEMLFSRYRRNEGGEIEEIRALQLAEPDAIGLVAGLPYARVGGKRVALPAPCVILEPNETQPEMSAFYCRTECSYASFYAPAALLKLGFGLDYTYEKNGENLSETYNGKMSPEIRLEDGTVRFRYQGINYEFYTNTCLVCANGRYRDLERPFLFLGEVLMFPVAELAELLGKHCSERNDTVYITDAPFSMGFTLSRYLREELLPDEPYIAQCTVTALSSDNGSFAVSESVVEMGGSVTVRTAPLPGFRTKEVRAAINGGAAQVNQIGPDEYLICNIEGNAEVAAIFAPSDEKSAAS